MFLRALLAFLALPGVVALLVPAWIAWNRPLAIYTCFVIVAFHLRVVFGEEPWLARTHGAAWEEYPSKVPRWLL